MKPKPNKEMYNILAAAIVLIISVVLLANKLLSTGGVQLILEDGRAVPIEAVSFFSFNDVLFFIIAAWFGGMAFLYIILSSKENAPTEFKNDTTADTEQKDTSNSQLAVDMLLEGDEQSLFKYIVENNNILQRNLVSMTGFSEPKVSRLLDRLEKRGLIFRQRDGMGNRVLLKKG
jgi:uncharacterized membrane protein